MWSLDFKAGIVTRLLEARRSLSNAVVLFERLLRRTDSRDVQALGSCLRECISDPIQLDRSDVIPEAGNGDS